MSQFFDSVEVKAGVEARVSSANFQPLWLVANRYGTVADRKSDISPYLRFSNKHVIAAPEYQNDRGFYDYNEVSLLYGLSLYNNNHFQSTFIEEGYVKLEYKNWSLRAGRFEETTGDMDPELSSGSLGISANALPIPKIGIAVTDYTKVPFTGRWLQFKGTFAHGWLGSDRYIQNTYYHEKTFFLRIGPRRFKVYGGIEHFVEWGGHSGSQQFNKSLKGFWNAFLAKGINNNGDANGHHGDQRGVLEGGAYWENDAITLHGYLQKPFEGKDELSLKNKNFLSGLELSMKNKYTGIQKIVLEVISTKSVNDYIPIIKRESDYNNSVYKTGWEYQGNIIGTPLFMNRMRANKYFPDIKPFNWDGNDSIPGNSNIVNNRIFAVHLGTSYYLSEQLEGKTLLTYTKNHGSSAIAFAPGKDQVYGLQQLFYEIGDHIKLTAALGFEWGQLTDSFVAGGLIGAEWHITRNKKREQYYWKY